MTQQTYRLNLGGTLPATLTATHLGASYRIELATNTAALIEQTGTVRSVIAELFGRLQAFLAASQLPRRQPQPDERFSREFGGVRLDCAHDVTTLAVDGATADHLAALLRYEVRE